MKLNFAGSGLLALMIGVLAGCNGGGDDAAPAATTTTTTTAVATTTTTTLAAAATGATITAVTVNSPPVVTFVVRDSTGNHVSGLKLANTTSSAAGLAADPNCSQTNVTFAMAKLNAPTDDSPSTWQSLISRQRYATADLTTPRYSTADATKKEYPPTYRYAVVEGTTDPKPTATTTITKADGTTSSGKFANTAGADRIVGELVENAAAGTYTYYFATDVSTSLLMADAVDVKNISLGKVANNGNVAVKDGTTIHRVGAQLCYTDTATQAKVVVNPTFDFTLGANGVAVPVTGSDGKPAAYKKVVDKASCNECHSTLTAHVTRVDPNYCVICHNPGSTDYNTNNPIDLKVMIHRFHMGKGSLPEGGKGLTKDYRVTNNILGAAKVTLSTGEVRGFVFPQAPQNCVKCHDGSATATNRTAQGDNWKNVPSRNACGACHDGIDFATGKGVTLADAAKGLTTSTYGHVGGSKQDDTQCAVCHGAADIPVYHSDRTPTTADAAKRTMSAEITGVAIDVVPTAATAASTAGSTGTGNVTVTFTLTDNGAPVTASTAFSGLNISLAKLNPAANGSSTNWQSYTGRVRTSVAAKPPVIQGYYEDGTKGTLTHTGNGVWTYKFALLNASTPGDIRTIDHAHNASSSSVTGIYSAASMPILPNATFTDTSQTTVVYEWWKTHRVGMEFNKAASGSTAAIANKFNAIYDFVPLADAARKAETRNIVSMNTCATCHGGVMLHKGFTTEYCVTCHNQNTFDPATGAYDAATGKITATTVDFQQIVHKVHMGRDLPSVKAGVSYTINGARHNYSYGAFPGEITDCVVCHSPTAKKANGTTLLENAANWYTTPTKRACGTCHDSATVTTHIDSQITATGEQCTFCHSSTSSYGLDVKSVHSK